MNAQFLILFRLEESVICFKDVQLLKASSPTLVTFDGRVIEVKPVHPMKVSLSMLVTLLGMVMDVNPVQW